MFNRIRWRVTKDSPRAHGSEPYLTAEDAMAEACPLLTLSLYDVWIECADGTRIEVDEILRKCRRLQGIDSFPAQVVESRMSTSALNPLPERGPCRAMPSSSPY